MKIIYKSKYGAAEKYAEMLGKTLSCEVIDLKKAAKGETDVIFVGAVYGGEIRGFDKLVKKGIRPVAVFCVGATAPTDGLAESIKRDNFTADMDDIPLFYGRGAWEESSFCFSDRMLCKIVRSMAKKNPDGMNDSMKFMVSLMGMVHDWTDEKYLLPIEEYIGATSK